MAKFKNIIVTIEKDTYDEFYLKSYWLEDIDISILHPVNCECITSDFNRLCDMGWFEEYINSVGLEYAIIDELPQVERRAKILQINCSMDCAPYSTFDEYGCDEYLIINSIKILE
jgi:hypothetical protein